MAKIKKHIPNSMTLFNIGLAIASILLTQSGEYVKAGGLILVTVIVDCFDGYLARRFNSTSKIGGYLDTIADFLSFSLAGGFLTMRVFDVHPVVIAVYVLASAFRLWYFMRTKNTTHFYGVPTTVCGGFLATVAILRPTTAFMTEMVLILSLLMLSRKKYFRLEIKNRKTLTFFIAAFLSLYVLDFMLAIQAMSYLFLGYIILGWLKVKDEEE